jgi:hypothetical protein
MIIVRGDGTNIRHSSNGAGYIEWGLIERLHASTHDCFLERKYFVCTLCTTKIVRSKYSKSQRGGDIAVK